MGNAPGDIRSRNSSGAPGVARVDRYAQTRIYFFLPEVERDAGWVTPIARQTRAYFAPVDRVNGPTAIFDPSQNKRLSTDAPPAPWIDLGWIENFQRTSTSQIEPLTGGTAGAVSAQARHALGARVDFEFRDWGKLQMALAGGAEHMNVLATDPSASRAGSGGIPLGAVPLLAGSTATELVLGAGAIAGFEPGDLVACDVDYAQQVGYVGTGISGAYVKNPGCAAGCQLCAASYVQRRARRAGDGDFVAADAGVAGGSAGGWGVGAAGHRFCGPRRAARFCNSGRGCSWRKTNLADECVSSIRFESVHGEGGVGSGERDRDSKADWRIGAAGFVYGAAYGGYQRRGCRALLSELLSGWWSGGLLVVFPPLIAKAAKPTTSAKA
jgi:hypothetical protein